MSTTPESVLSRFLRYVAFDTQSNASSATHPSTPGQRELALLLRDELLALGATDVILDDFGYVYAFIEASSRAADGSELPSLGFIAHLDTSQATSATGVKAQVHPDYQGGPLVLNVTHDMLLSPKTYPALANYIGCDIVTSDGTTLLGADDKAGIAEIMCMAETLLLDRSIEHPRICIAFTPDEEIGRGAEHFDVAGFGATYAYTVDGGAWGTVEYENFNAAEAHITISGVNIHPGHAKGKMKNALLIAMEFNSLLPDEERPESTEGYRGFYMLENMSGTVESVHMSYLIRDHNRKKFDVKKQRLVFITQALNEKYGEGTVACSMDDTYYNMREKIEPHMHLVETVKAAIHDLGGDAETPPVRGGTDGALLSYKGLPCPNICTGGHNFHSRFEFIPVQSMEKTCELLVEVAKRAVRAAQ